MRSYAIVSACVLLNLLPCVGYAQPSTSQLLHRADSLADYMQFVQAAAIADSLLTTKLTDRDRA